MESSDLAWETTPLCFGGWKGFHCAHKSTLSMIAAPFLPLLQNMSPQNPLPCLQTFAVKHLVHSRLGLSRPLWDWGSLQVQQGLYPSVSENKAGIGKAGWCEAPVSQCACSHAESIRSKLATGLSTEGM